MWYQNITIIYYSYSIDTNYDFKFNIRSWDVNYRKTYEYKLSGANNNS
jgi:hypothetical protein